MTKILKCGHCKKFVEVQDSYVWSECPKCHNRKNRKRKGLSMKQTWKAFGFLSKRKFMKTRGSLMKSEALKEHAWNEYIQQCNETIDTVNRKYKIRTYPIKTLKTCIAVRDYILNGYSGTHQNEDYEWHIATMSCRGCYEFYLAWKCSTKMWSDESDEDEFFNEF